MATFTVTNTADSGAGSLRQAVLDANAAAGADTIVFSAAFDGGADDIDPADQRPDQDHRRADHRRRRRA